MVSIDNAGEYPIAIVPPFDGEEEARLNWYFEEHLSFPFTEQVDIVRPGSCQELARRLQQARLWQASGDTTLPAAVAATLGVTLEQAEEVLREGVSE